MTDTKVSRSWIFFTPSWHVIINSSCRTGLTLVCCCIPKRICFITINLNAFIISETKSLFWWTSLICINTTFVILIPFLSRRAVGYTILINNWPLMIQRTSFTLQCVLIKWWLIGRTLKAFKVDRIPIRCGWRTHWSSSSFLTLIWLLIEIFIWCTLNSHWLWNTLTGQLIKILLICANSTCFLYFIIEWLIIATFIAAVCLVIPIWPFRRTKWMSVIILNLTFLAGCIKIVTFRTFLVRRFTDTSLLVPSFIWLAFSAFF